MSERATTTVIPTEVTYQIWSERDGQAMRHYVSGYSFEAACEKVGYLNDEEDSLARLEALTHPSSVRSHTRYFVVRAITMLEEVKL